MSTPLLNPYAAPAKPSERSIPSSRDELERAPASRLARLAAHSVDFLLVVGVAFWVQAGITTAVDRGIVSKLVFRSVSLWFPILFGGFATVAVCGVLGRSLGKRAMGLRVERSNGGPASLFRVCILRNILPAAVLCGLGVFAMSLRYVLASAWVSVAIIVYALFAAVDALVIFRDDRRCIHDFVAGTIVVRELAHTPHRRKFLLWPS